MSSLTPTIPGIIAPSPRPVSLLSFCDEESAIDDDWSGLLLLLLKSMTLIEDDESSLESEGPEKSR